MISNVVNHLYNLMHKENEKRGIRLIVDSKNDYEVEADFDMIQQVLINLITNSISAVDEIKDPEIKIIYGTDYIGNNYISVIDNGCGIGKDDIEQIFIPFYTTKKDGSGIGLSHLF